MVFCYQNCSDLLWEKIVLVIEKKLLKFKAEGRKFSKILRSLEQFIQAVKGQNNFCEQNAFLTCPACFGKVKKVKNCSDTVWINRSSDLKNFAISWPTALNFKSFFSITKGQLISKGNFNDFNSLKKRA